MRLGVHVRVGGGYAAAVDYARRIGCTSLQFFSGNPKTYRIGAVDAPALAAFREAREAAGIGPVAIHTSYLINLATPDPRMFANSLRLLEHELAVAAVGGVAYVNTHLGSYGERDRESGFAQVADALGRALDGVGAGVHLVLENSAGAGTLCGGTLEELGALVRAVDHPQLAVCLDTAHAWAAGYDLSHAAGVDRFFEEAERRIGLDRIVMFHLNDTQVGLGAHKDRHWHLGDGNIGLDGFRALLTHPATRGKVGILETPGEEEDDARNLRTAFALAEAAAA